MSKEFRSLGVLCKQSDQRSSVDDSCGAPFATSLTSMFELVRSACRELQRRKPKHTGAAAPLPSQGRGAGVGFKMLPPSQSVAFLFACGATRILM